MPEIVAKSARSDGAPCYGRVLRSKETAVLLILAIILLCISIAGGAIVHPLLFVLAIVALVMFFTGR